MKFFRVWAIARKEFIHVWRDPRSLGMAIAIPMLLLVLGYWGGFLAGRRQLGL